MREDGIAGAQPSPGWPPPDDFPMTPAEVYAYRERVRPGVRTAFSPVEPGGTWTCFKSRGTYEWFLHPSDAEVWLRDGVIIEGKHLKVELTSTPYCWWIGAIQVVARDDSVNTGFIPSGVGAAA